MEMETSALAELEQCEKIIEKGIIEVGNELASIRDKRLYKARGYTSFETYCQERWNFSIAYSNRMIQASQVVALLQENPAPIGATEEEGDPNLTLPTRESQARELSSLRDRPSVMRQVWDQAVKRSPQKPPTAALIQETRQEYLNRVTGYVDSYIQYMDHAVNVLNTLTKHDIEDKLIPLLREAYFKHQEVGSKILGVPDESSLRRVK
jgi:hypothetical protein